MSFILNSICRKKIELIKRLNNSDIYGIIRIEGVIAGRRISMSKKGKIITTFHDLKSEDNEETLFFFIVHLLKARIELHMENGEKKYEE